MVSGKRLQERSHESAEADKAAGSGLDVGGSTSGAGAGASASAGGARFAGTRTGPGGVGARARAGCARSSGGRGKEKSGAVVGTDSDSAGLVEGAAGSREEEGVDTSADSRDVSGNGLRGDDSRLVGNGVGLLSNGAVNSGHASHDAQRVGLGEVGSLGSRVGGRALWIMSGLVSEAIGEGCAYLSRSNGESSSRDEDGGAHFGSFVIRIGSGVVVFCG